jgi:outer membrane protein OmpA-like peptidoglycan-associated protein
MTRRTLRAGAVTLATLVVSGCAVTRENQGACKASAAVLGALVGGAALGVGVGVGTDNGGAGAGAGVGGAVLGGVAGYYIGTHFCQVPEAPPPPPPPPPAAPRKIETLTGPSFDFNKATLTATGREHVDHAVQVLRAETGLRVTVEGYTDSVGSDAYNMKLSQRRADAVRDYLVSKGIASDRIRTEAFGETRPVASNDTAEGRAQNRRVEIIAR